MDDVRLRVGLSFLEFYSKRVFILISVHNQKAGSYEQDFNSIVGFRDFRPHVYGGVQDRGFAGLF